ncbi:MULTISPECIES: helix-turn-helix domain-containing protein [unclassified Pseudonocardia]|uniref:helix-turn-helix transcriptional regulator n=1 Tax=unclassified Pseudonocardia TaxID=2619320 RepID=UPI0001FFE2CA|nr:helix-turn-helix domain-containing protein [Pseudonocardia sp. Ae707_Ps1]OLM20851.1 hypothetical protein Ae707Ps1_5110 [Pseudonocardia sp. Ae707_Ps1]
MAELSLLTVDEVCAVLRVERKTLLNWRAKGYGPTGFRLGRAVVFDRDEVMRWIEEQRSADRISDRAS